MAGGCCWTNSHLPMQAVDYWSFISENMSYFKVANCRNYVLFQPQNMDLIEELLLKRKDSWTTLHRPNRIISSFLSLKSTRFMKMDKEYIKGIFSLFYLTDPPVCWMTNIFYSNSFSKDLMKQNTAP